MLSPVILIYNFGSKPKGRSNIVSQNKVHYSLCPQHLLSVSLKLKPFYVLPL